MLSSVGVKARSGKEDTTLLSMADCRVKQATVSTATRYGIKPRIQGCPRGSVRMGGQRIRYYKKKKTDTHPHGTVLMSLRFIGWWKFVGCYQTYSQTCVAAVRTWFRTLDRFSTFDGLSKAATFHTSRNTEVLLLTVYVGRHPIIRIVGAVQFCRFIPEEVCHVYIYTLKLKISIYLCASESWQWSK